MVNCIREDGWIMNKQICNAVRMNEDRKKMMNENHSGGENIAEKISNQINEFASKVDCNDFVPC